MKTIMVTGGLGHIGSLLIRNLPEYDVVVVDDLSCQRYCSLFNLGRKITFIEKSYTNLTDKELEGIDVVVHLAAITDAVSSFEKAKEVYKANVSDTIDFFRRVYNNTKVNLVIFPSSTSVYGKAKDIMYEDDDNVNPQSPYAESKILVEKELVDLSKISRNDINYLVFRFGTIFGVSPGMRFHTAINKFCYQASYGMPLTVWRENFEQYRPYLGLNDAIQSVKMGIENPLMYNNIYNVLSDNYKLSDIVNYIKFNIPDIQVNFVDTPLVNQYSYFVDNTKIKSFGFMPLDHLGNEIVKMLELLSGV